MEMNFEINKALRCLKDGLIILYPTDTIWGLGCDALNVKAIEKLNLIKNRPIEKSYIILLSEVNDLKKYVVTINEKILNTVQNFKEPTTVIYDQAQNLPETLLNKEGSIAIRIVKDDLCKKIIDELGHPIVSTSPNFSGDKTPFFYDEINQQIKEKVDFIFSKTALNDTLKSPSKIIKINQEGLFSVIR